MQHVFPGNNHLVSKRENVSFSNNNQEKVSPWYNFLYKCVCLLDDFFASEE